MKGKLVILVVITLQAGNAYTDPCEVHRNITDVDLLTNHTYKEGQACDFTPSENTPAWYRYIATPVGAMATSCPGRTSCGGKEQIWINNTLPSYADGITSVESCVSTVFKCCDIKTTTLMKNCNSFYVVQLRKPPRCSTHYCFDPAITKLETVLTTQSTSPTTTEMTTASTPSTKIHTAQTTRSTSIQATTPNTSTRSSIMSTQKTSYPTIPTSSAEIETTEKTTASITYFSYSSTSHNQVVTALTTQLTSTKSTEMTTASTPSSTILTTPTTRTTSIQTTTPYNLTISNIMSTQNISHPTVPTSSAEIGTQLTSHFTETHTTFVSNENDIDKDKGKTTALAAGFGTTGAVFIVASIFAAFFVLHRKMRPKTNPIYPDEYICPEKEDTIKKPIFNPASLKDTANLSEQEVTITFERDYE